MWQEGTFAFDANVLLNLYRYSEPTRTELLGILDALQPRIYLPHQAGLEFHRGRIAVISEHRKAYADVRAFVEEQKRLIASKTDSLYRDTAKEAEELVQAAAAALDRVAERLTNQEDVAVRQTNSSEDDPIWTAVRRLFGDRVGDPLTQEELANLYVEGAGRYASGIPPGFEDADKPEPERYGDLVLWRQIIKVASGTARPLIFVTDDRKDDWWWRVGGQTVGPLPNLVAEFARDAGVGFYMYTPESFMRFAGDVLNRTVSEEAVGEISSLRARQPDDDVEEAPEATADRPSGWSPGDPIRHERLGDGHVIELRVIDGRQFIRAEFPGGGVFRIPVGSSRISHRDAATWHAGERVRHKRFGNGIVVSSRVVKGDEEVTVAFVGEGVKRLISAYAGLERVKLPDEPED